MNTDSKWPCSQCTYLNFSNALKCTMCGISRSPTLISAIAAGDDIYEVGVKSCVSHTNTSTPYIQETGDDKKWVCPTCTYLNFSKNLKCIQCLTVKKPVIIDQMKSLSINTNPPSNAPSDASPVKGNDRNEAQEAPTVPSQSVGGAGQISPKQLWPKDSVALPDQNLPSFKWRCRGCTYENWPRSVKCVMCATQKGSLPVAANSQPARLATPPPPPETKAKERASLAGKERPPPPPLGIIQRDLGTEARSGEASPPSRNCESFNEINKSRSETQALNTLNQSTNPPPPSVGAGSGGGSGTGGGGGSRMSPPVTSVQQQQQQSVSAPQNIRQMEGAVALNNYETERILRQLRRRLREADWIWLNACIGVVEGNYEPVQAYLSSG